MFFHYFYFNAHTYNTEFMHFRTNLFVCIFIHSGFEIQNFEIRICLLKVELILISSFKTQINSTFETSNFSLSFRISGMWTLNIIKAPCHLPENTEKSAFFLFSPRPFRQIGKTRVLKPSKRAEIVATLNFRVRKTPHGKGAFQKRERAKKGCF